VNQHEGATSPRYLEKNLKGKNSFLVGCSTVPHNHVKRDIFVNLKMYIVRGMNLSLWVLLIMFKRSYHGGSVNQSISVEKSLKLAMDGTCDQ
jgi:hypothetical protein